MRRLARSLVPLALLFSTPAFAQVNAEALRSTLKKNPRFLWLEGALAGRAGNTQTMTFNGSVFGAVAHGPHLFFAKATADYGQARSTTTVARWLAHARYNYRVNALLALEALGQVQHDRFRRIEVRDLYGAGLRFSFFNTNDFELFAGTTYIFEHEVIEGVQGSSGSNEVWNRSSNYIGFNGKMAALVDANAVTYIQPRWDRPADVRVLSEAYLTVTITKVLSARVSGSLWFDSDPPSGVRSFDAEIKNSLLVKLD